MNNGKRRILKCTLLIIFAVLMVGVVLTIGSQKASAETETTECRYVGGYGGNYCDVAHDGEYLYVAHVQGLSIFDVSDESEPEKIGFVYTGGAYGVAVDGDYAYVADGENGLIIVDITDKTDPQKVGGYDTSGDVGGVAVAGDYAYVVDGEIGLIIIDITDETDPQKVGGYDTSGYAQSVAVAGDYAYVADDENGLVIVDITDKTDPQKVGGYDTSGGAYGVAVDGDYAYVADGGNGLVIVDITDKTDPQKVGGYDTGRDAEGVVVIGDYAYMANDENGLVIIDISDETDPLRVGWYDTSGYAQSVAVAGDYAYVADYSNGLVIVDISDETDPLRVGWYDTSGYARSVALAGDYAYVADGENGLIIIDISDETDPLRVGGYDTSGYTQSVAVAGDYACVADHKNGLVIVDITDKTDPQKVGGYDTSGYAHRVAVSGDYAYVADMHKGLVIVDISNLENPTLVGHYDTANSASDVTVSGNYAYVADHNNGLVIVDINDPENPTLEGHYETTGYAYEVAVSGDYAYVADYNKGLVVVNVSDPANPTKKGGYDTDGAACGVAVSGDYAYVADVINGLVVVNVSDPANPTKEGRYDTPYTWGVAVNGDYAYVADQYNGLVIVEIISGDNEKPVARIDSISPNPADEGDTVHFIGRGSPSEEIIQYAWRTNIDDEIYNGSSSEFNFSDLSVGDHTIYLKVMNESGFWSDEVSDTLIVEEEGTSNIKPTVSITSPEHNSEVMNIVTIQGTASDEDGDETLEAVEMSIDGEDWYAVAGTSSWSYEWNTLDVLNGAHEIRMRAFDGEDYSEIEQISFQVQNSPPNNIPIVSIQYPFDHTTLYGDEIIISGVSSDEDGNEQIQIIEVSINDGDWITVTETTEWTYKWDASSINMGEHTLEARSFDGVDYSDIDSVIIAYSIFDFDVDIKFLARSTGKSIVKPSQEIHLRVNVTGNHDEFTVFGISQMSFEWEDTPSFESTTVPQFEVEILQNRNRFWWFNFSAPKDEGTYTCHIIARFTPDDTNYVTESKSYEVEVINKQTPLTNKALIIRPFTFDGYIEYSQDVKDIFPSEYEVYELDNHESGYLLGSIPTREYIDVLEEITIPKLESELNKDYGIIYFSTHADEAGIPIEVFDDIEQRDIRFIALRNMGYMSREDSIKNMEIYNTTISLDTLDGKYVISVTPNFFLRASSFPNSLIYVEGCDLGKNEQIDAVVTERGIGGFVGYDGKILVQKDRILCTEAYEVSEKLFDYMINDGIPMQIACELVGFGSTFDGNALPGCSHTISLVPHDNGNTHFYLTSEVNVAINEVSPQYAVPNKIIHISGSVKTCTGKGLESVGISVYLDDTLSQFDTTTNADGSFSVDVTCPEDVGNSLKITIVALWVYELGSAEQSTYVDYDNDGLSNDDEIPLGSDPRNPDSDGDGVSDGDEAEAGTDPTDSSSKPGGGGEDDDNDGGFIPGFDAALLAAGMGVSMLIFSVRKKEA